MHQHLQHALDVEFWTIPLYLTALYSIKGLKALSPKDYPDSAKLIQSVVIQEMLHLELVCNICNAVGYPPKFNPPVYEDVCQIPLIEPRPEAIPEFLRGYASRPGPLTPDLLKFFCVVELPHNLEDFNPEEGTSFNSIAELYEALKIGLRHLWDSCYVGAANNHRQKETFSEYERPSGVHHGFSVTVNNLEEALDAIEAIVAQGEGADQKNVPLEYQPPKTNKENDFDPGGYKGDLSHYQKFCILLYRNRHLPEVYTVTRCEHIKEQEHLDAAYGQFLQALTDGFSSGGSEMPSVFWDSMYALSHAIIGVWEKGACPQFNAHAFLSFQPE